jgi:hypothetical protein
LLFKRALFSFASLLIVSSCELINPVEEIPSFIQIDSFVMEDNVLADEGSLSHDIRDAWVFIDDEMIGIYELPARIPILESGIHKLTVGPGIFVSTNSTNRDNYAFYNAHIDQNFNLIAGETQFVTPVSSYRDPGSTYAYEVIDDFESVIVQIDSFNGSQVPIIQTQDKGFVFEGSGSGLVSIKSTDSLAFFKTPTVELIGDGKLTYLEIDYYSDYTFTIYGRAINTGYQNETFELLNLKPTTDEEDEKEWKKAYINITSMTSGALNPAGFYIFFNISLNNVAERVDGYVAFDNIKFVYQR